MSDRKDCPQDKMLSDIQLFFKEAFCAKKATFLLDKAFDIKAVVELECPNRGVFHIGFLEKHTNKEEKR